MNLNIENKIMKQYIDKDILVAEIDRRIKVLQNHPKENHKTICHLDSVKQFLNTFEVKNVDLESEITLWANAIPEIRLDDVERLATYFFELGIKTQKVE